MKCIISFPSTVFWKKIVEFLGILPLFFTIQAPRRKIYGQPFTCLTSIPVPNADLRPVARRLCGSLLQPTKKQRTAPVLCFFASSVPRPAESVPIRPRNVPAQAGQYNYSKYSRYSSEKIFPPRRLIPPYKCCIIRGSIASRFLVSIICIIS